MLFGNLAPGDAQHFEAVQALLRVVGGGKLDEEVDSVLKTPAKTAPSKNARCAQSRASAR
jgi:hypothetical protein